MCDRSSAGIRSVRRQWIRVCVWIALSLTALCWLTGNPSQAADEGDRITVTAMGHALAKIDVLEVRATVSGSATLAADALRKYRENRRRAIDALGRLKLKGLTIEGNGPGVGTVSPTANRQGVVFNFGQNQAPNQPSNVVVSEVLSMRLSPIDQFKNEEILDLISKIVDTAKDVGLEVGPPPSNIEISVDSDQKSSLARFHSTHVEEARRAAVRSAMQIARQKAEELAEFSHARLAGSSSVREIAGPWSLSAGNPAAFWASMITGNDSSDRADSEERSSTVFKPLPITVVLEAQFATERSK